MSSDLQTQTAIAYLRSPAAIRTRCNQLFKLACAGKLSHFRVNLAALDRTANYVLQVIRETYPDLDIPFHSRWRHFEVGKHPRLEWLETKLASLSPRDRAKAKFDLVILSVLLDAGAGADWHYVEPATGEVFQRSEGLAIASFDLFCDGSFSEIGACQATAIALQKLRLETLAEGFQVRPDNPLVGLEGRLSLLQRLGHTLTQHPNLFQSSSPRPGDLVDYLVKQSVNGTLDANIVLQSVLEGFGDIWPGRVILEGVNLGDVWAHSALSGNTPEAPLVPFHKLSQWLTYSLLEPLQELGLDIVGLEQLTGLPEYRNGGLCLDLGLLQVKDPTILQQTHLPSSEVIVEWRALTVVCLELIADAIRKTLGMTAQELPLVKVLQGGTWIAGRKIAKELRPGGIPPLQIDSDGTVF